MLCGSSNITPRRALRRRLHTLGGQSSQFRPDSLDLLRCLPASHGQEARSAGLIFQNPVPGELAALDIREDLTHPLPHALVYDLRSRSVVAVLGGVRDGVAHTGETTLVDEVHDQL